MTQRNRSQGWQHAKRSGHRNEDALHDLLLQDRDYQSDFLRRLGAEGSRIAQAEVGGIRETDVPSLLPGRTKSKTDLRLLLDSGEEYRISIKKSLSGQVYLIRDTRFLQGMCLQYGIPIPSEVERAIRLFWGSADDLDQLLPRYATRPAYERRKHRLTADSLYGLDPALSGILPVWFSEHAGLIADLCFSRGLAAQPEDWASHIWYKNTLGKTRWTADPHLPALPACAGPLRRSAPATAGREGAPPSSCLSALFSGIRDRCSFTTATRTLPPCWTTHRSGSPYKRRRMAEPSCGVFHKAERQSWKTHSSAHTGKHSGAGPPNDPTTETEGIKWKFDRSHRPTTEWRSAGYMRKAGNSHTGASSLRIIWIRSPGGAGCLYSMFRAAHPDLHGQRQNCGNGRLWSIPYRPAGRLGRDHLDLPAAGLDGEGLRNGADERRPFRMPQAGI